MCCMTMCMILPMQSGLFRNIFGAYKYEFLVFLFFPLSSRKRLAARSHVLMPPAACHGSTGCSPAPSIPTYRSVKPRPLTLVPPSLSLLPAALGHQQAALQRGNTKAPAHKELFLTEKRASCGIFLTCIEMKVQPVLLNASAQT